MNWIENKPLGTIFSEPSGVIPSCVHSENELSPSSSLPTLESFILQRLKNWSCACLQFLLAAGTSYKIIRKSQEVVSNLQIAVSHSRYLLAVNKFSRVCRAVVILRQHGKSRVLKHPESSVIAASWWRFLDTSECTLLEEKKMEWLRFAALVLLASIACGRETWQKPGCHKVG